MDDYQFRVIISLLVVILCLLIGTILVILCVVSRTQGTTVTYRGDLSDLSQEKIADLRALAGLSKN